MPLTRRPLLLIEILIGSCAMALHKEVLMTMWGYISVDFPRVGTTTRYTEQLGAKRDHFKGTYTVSTQTRTDFETKRKSLFLLSLAP